MTRQLRRLLVIAGAALILAGCGDDGSPVDDGGGDGAEFKVSDFQSAEECKDCHPVHFEEWSGSMHAYAFTDPLFFALNERAIMDQGQEQPEFCIQCHSPIGFLTGEAIGVVDPATQPAVIQEGITCDVCHVTIDPGEANDGLIGSDSSSYMTFNPGVIKYGPIADPVRNSFHLSEKRTFFQNSTACRNCHDIFIEGEPLEVTWTEWLGSFSAMGRECQECHMPTYQGEAAVGGPIRSLTRHEFVGVDLAITDFPMKERQRAAVESLMTTAGAIEGLTAERFAEGESLSVIVGVRNLTGHNMPSGVGFNRDCWIRLVVSAGGESVFESGMFDEDRELDYNGTRDPQFKRFYSVLKGERTEVATLDINLTLTPLQYDETEYRMAIESGTEQFDLDAAFLFRALPPSFVIDAGHPELSGEEFLPVYTIDEMQVSVTVE